MARRFEFFFDFMSPYSYLASLRVPEVARRTGAEVEWKPCYLPGIMKATGNVGPVSIPTKAMYVFKDMNDWAALLGLRPIVLPDPFPFVAAAADRVALVLDASVRPAFVAHLFARIWHDGVSCNEPAILAESLRAVGVSAPEAVLEQAQSQAIRDVLRAHTDDAVARNAFGVPTFYVGEQMFVGNDRLDFVERALLKS